MEDWPMGKTLLLTFSFFPDSFVAQHTFSSYYVFFPDSFVAQHIFSSYYVSGAGDRLVPTIGEVTLLQETNLLYPRDFPSKNTGVGCHALLQGIFPTQG